MSFSSLAMASLGRGGGGRCPRLDSLFSISVLYLHPVSRTSALAGVTVAQPSVTAALGAGSSPHPAGKGCSGRNLGRRAGVCPAPGPVCAEALGLRLQEGSAAGGGAWRWPCTNIRVCPRQGLLQNTILSVHTSK